MQKSDFYGSKTLYPKEPVSGSVCWESPSNLAIVKYWGKYGEQLPRNASLSITLSSAVTTTKIYYEYNPKKKGLSTTFLFEREENTAFKARIDRFLSGLVHYYPYLDNCSLAIESSNSFPHSSGIASSASSMSALSLCLSDIEANLKEAQPTMFFEKASFISRLGSGSACRSVYPSFAEWGVNSAFENSSDLYAVPFSDYDPIFDTLKNDILIVSKTEKSVSSSAGHKLMEDNPYSTERFVQANNRIADLKTMLKSGDIDGFGKLLESEALTLHALMMASDPSYMLMEPNTINVINHIRNYRKETNTPIYFSLDAGPNVHIISFEKDRIAVEKLLAKMKGFSVDNTILADKIGQGPKRI